jgi:hypothetical protein
MTKKLEVIKKEIEKEVQEQFKKLNEKEEVIDYCPGCNVAYCQGRYTTGQCE